jgi:hypothetical protein
MINLGKAIQGFWRSQQFKSAVKQGKTHLAEKILQDIEKSGTPLSWVEQLFKDKLKAEIYLDSRNSEIASLTQRLNQALKKNQDLAFKDEFDWFDNFAINQEFMDFIAKTFKFVEHDDYKLQVTGIDERIFDDFEADLAAFLKEEFSRIPPEQLKVEMQKAVDDLNQLKHGKDPDYSFSLTPHVYLMRYFPEGVYCTYLAWFLIYQAGLLPTKFNVLDIAAGPGTSIYGLALFLRSSSGFFPLPAMHICYYSLEKETQLQCQGWQFWRRYIEKQALATNAYFRFDTCDVLTWDEQNSKLPEKFFDFIVISHCFFSDPVTSVQANRTYQQIFYQSLSDRGYALLIIQDKKIFRTYGFEQSENIQQEQEVILKLLAELGLKLVWYKYLKSTDSRKSFSGSDFGKFAGANLPKQRYMNPLLREHFDAKYPFHYTLDDYVILAQKA